MSLGLKAPTGGTSAYCQARQRISEDFLNKVFEKGVQALNHGVTSEDLWKGFTLKAIDGSSVQLLDTEENQTIYPQPSVQKTGCGTPTMGIVGICNLSHGGWEGFETCGWQKHDAKVAPLLLKYVEKNDLLLADRAFGSYEFICRIKSKGSHSLMRLHQARHRALDWRKGTRINSSERLVTWTKPVKQSASSTLSIEEWSALPETMTVRYIKYGYEDREGKKRTLILVTDLLDPHTYDRSELCSLYMRRWEIEVKLRDVKTTLNLELFAVRTPEMAHKTLQMMLIAHNLLRWVMQQAAHEAGKPNWTMSFKGCLDLITASQDKFRDYASHPRKRRNHFQNFIELCTTKTLNVRSFRSEPRSVKRRPKGYQFLTDPRHIFQVSDTRSSNYIKQRKAS